MTTIAVWLVQATVTGGRSLAAVNRVEQLPLGKGGAGQEAMKSLWKTMFRHCGLHPALELDGHEQARARDVGLIFGWETLSWSEKKPMGASGQPKMATSGETTDSGADQTPEVSGGTFWQGWCRRKDERGWSVVTRSSCKRGKSFEGCALWRTCGSGDMTTHKPGGPYGW